MDIYRYDEYRDVLRDLFEEKKEQDPDFSHRKFADAAGVKNPGILVDVIKGKSKLSPKLIDACVSVFELKGPEQDYFRLLVRYGQARRPEDKESVRRDLVHRRHHSKFARLNPGQSRYYEDTLYPKVIAAVEVLGESGDMNQLGAFLDPPVPQSRAIKALAELVGWGLILRNEKGSYRVKERFLEPPETLKGSVRRMNKQWLEEAPEALFRLPPSRRHIGTLLVSVSRETRGQILEKVEKLRQEVLHLIQNDDNPELVMQLSLIYIPKSKEKSS